MIFTALPRAAGQPGRGRRPCRAPSPARIRSSRSGLLTSASRTPSTSGGTPPATRASASSSTCPTAAGPTPPRSAHRSGHGAPARRSSPPDRPPPPPRRGGTILAGRPPLSMRTRMARLVPHARALTAGRDPGRCARCPRRRSPTSGPAPGFAVMSSFLVIFVTLLVVAASMLAWPFRALWRLAAPQRTAALVHRPADRHRLRRPGPGADRSASWPRACCPTSRSWRRSGAYRPLQTTYPALSPVAWSSFSTGTHPARHNIFDFLDRDRRTYLPRCRRRASARSNASSASASTSSRAIVPSSRTCGARRRSGRILGERRIWSTILRVPITFPPDRFYGAELSAMCVPDLLGTQGTFLLFTTRPARGTLQGGRHPRAGRRAGRPHRPASSPARRTASSSAIRRSKRRSRSRSTAPPRRATLTVGGTTTCRSPLGELSGWVSMPVPGRARRDRGRHRPLQLLELGEHVSLYVSPINLDPEQPAMPISHPVLLLGLPRQAPRPVRDARPGRRHLGAERGRHRRRHVPAAGPRHRRRAADDVPDGARPAAPRHPGLRVRRHRPHPAHVLALPRRRATRRIAPDVPDRAQARHPRAVPEERRAGRRGAAARCGPTTC